MHEWEDESKGRSIGSKPKGYWAQKKEIRRKITQIQMVYPSFSMTLLKQALYVARPVYLQRWVIQGSRVEI